MEFKAFKSNILLQEKHSTEQFLLILGVKLHKDIFQW